MAITRKKNIGLLLIEAGILEPEQLEQALLKQSKEATSGYIGEVLINGGLIDEKTRNRFLSQQLHIPTVELGHFDVDKSVLGMIPERIVREYNVLPVFKLNNKKINFAVPTGNFGDIYAGYIAKKMGLGIDKLIVATNENDILKRAINTGEYKPDQTKSSFSPSMDIQVSSNFERQLFESCDRDSEKIKKIMKSFTEQENYELEKKILTNEKTKMKKFKKRLIRIS